MKYLFSLFLSISLYPQNNSLDDSQMESLNRNIISYSIKYSEQDNYDDFFPLQGWRLNLEVRKDQEAIELENCNWTLYKVINDNFSFIKNDGKLATQKVFSDGITEYYLLSKSYLIALTEKNDLIFLGGNFFKTSIADKFYLSTKDMKSFNYFLKIKLYNYDLDAIYFVKRKGNYLFFKANSNVLSRQIKIMIDNINFDDIKVK